VSGARDARLLGAYILPGRVPDPRPGLEQALAAERLGLGAIWLSERWGTKDVPVLFGALSQTTERIRLGAAAMHFQTRHPLVLASTAVTLQTLSGGRFVLGVGKLTPGLWRSYGLPNATNALLADTADMIRRLAAGEEVSYHGPAGDYPSMRLIDVPAVPFAPIALTAIGPRTLEAAGRSFDGVLLHPFVSPEGVTRSAAAVRDAAVSAGRPPDAVRVYASVVVAKPADVDILVRARAVTYFQSEPLGSMLVGVNGWDPQPLQRLREHPLVRALGGSYADSGLTKQQLVEVSATLPDEWLASTSAIGEPPDRAARLHEYLDAGADELILHGSTPDMLDDTVAAFLAATSRGGTPLLSRERA